MRDFIEIVEEGRKEQVLGSHEWKRMALRHAMDPDQAAFTVLVPAVTGLPMSIFISGQKRFPCFIVESKQTKTLEPSPDSKVFMYTESTDNTIVNKWLKINKKILVDYQKQKTDFVDLMRDMKSVRLVNINEMANFNKGRFNVPVTFFVRPEPNPLRHHARIKVNCTYSKNFNDTNNFSIILFPVVEKVDDHDQGRISNKDLQGMIQWISRNRQHFWDYICERIDWDQLNAHLSANPYP